MAGPFITYQWAYQLGVSVDVSAGKPEELPGRGGCRGRELLHALAARLRHSGCDVRQIRRLVPAVRRLRLQVSRQQVRAIRLDHQLAGGNAAHEWQQVSASALVADPASDTDVETHAQVVIQLVRLTCEAMSDAASSQRARVLSQDGDKVIVRVTLMQEHRLAD